MGRVAELGAEATAIVRQERVLLSRHEPPGMDNVLPARIEAATYLGAQISYVCGSQRLLITALVPNHPGFERFAPGEAVFVSWSGADCYIYADEGKASDVAGHAASGPADGPGVPPA